MNPHLCLAVARVEVLLENIKVEEVYQRIYVTVCLAVLLMNVSLRTPVLNALRCVPETCVPLSYMQTSHREQARIYNIFSVFAAAFLIRREPI